MFLPTPLLVSATVNLALAPLRRVRLLMAVEDDLAEEGVVPSNTDDGTGPRASASGSSSSGGDHTSSNTKGAEPSGGRSSGRSQGKQKDDLQHNRGGFGGALGAAKFLYQLGGIRAFYRGAALEYTGVVVKYLIQVAIVVPICRRVPLQMQRSYALTTLFHTVVLFFPVAPVQLLIDTIIVNACTDFAQREDVASSGAATTDASRAKAAVAAASAEKVTEVDGHKFRFRFHSLWDAAKAAWHTLPILPLANKLMFLDFAGRYVSSLFFNKVMGYFYDKLVGDGTSSASGDDAASSSSNTRALTILMRVVPPLVSICYGMLTYPIVSLPFSHFVRVRLHEREAAEAARAKEEEAREYRRTGQQGSNLNSTKSGMERSFHGSRSMHLRAYPRPEEEEDERLFADRVVELVCHWDVRDYLYFTYEQWGIRGLYRGYSMRVVTIISGVVCGALASEGVTHLQRSLRHLLQGMSSA